MALLYVITNVSGHIRVAIVLLQVTISHRFTFSKAFFHSMNDSVAEIKNRAMDLPS